MQRSIRPLLAAPLLALIGCTDSPNVVEVPDTETPQYGSPAGTEAAPVEAEADHPAFSDPGQPPVEEDVPSNAGGTVDLDEEPGPLSINPPSDLVDQPKAGAPAPPPAPEPKPEGGDDAPAPDTPTVIDEPSEPRAGRP